MRFRGVDVKIIRKEYQDNQEIMCRLMWELTLHVKLNTS